MQTPEHSVAQALVRAAADAGLLIRKLRWEGRIGAPDYVILASGMAFFVETKAPGEKPRLSQLAEFARLEKCGFPVAVVDTEYAAKLEVSRICAILKKM
ncbi:MAG: VRR-NUC domain-containing protein [Fibrobacter sp.]|nr:VRR-NUC domain-containing protein [Fibrobacter sp.]